MTETTSSIPNLERLMRDVLRRCFVAAYGDAWFSQLSQGVRAGVTKAADNARAQRPGEQLADDWEAAGLGEIRKALVSSWDTISPRVATVWSTREEAKVDLDRLQAYRGKALHAVGPSIGQIHIAEVDAMILRIRIGLEGMRRNLMSDEGEWWPYIEAIHSNISGFCVARNGRRGGWATLTEGDLVTFDVIGVHPNGSQDSLTYRLMVAGTGASAADDTGWIESSHFQVQVPRARSVFYHLYVADTDDVINYDRGFCAADVRPR